MTEERRECRLPFLTNQELISLVDGVRAGNDDAVQSLHETVSRFKYNFVRCLNHQDIEDAVQDTFVTVLEAIKKDSIRDPVRLMGYIKTVACRTISSVINDIRVARTRTVSMDDDPTVVLAASTEVIGYLEKRDLEKKAAKMIDALNDLDREVIIRFYFQNQTELQILEEMEINDNQFRNRKTKALDRLNVISQTGLKIAGIRRRLNLTNDKAITYSRPRTCLNRLGVRGV